MFTDNMTKEASVAQLLTRLFIDFLQMQGIVKRSAILEWHPPERTAGMPEMSMSMTMAITNNCSRGAHHREAEPTHARDLRWHDIRRSANPYAANYYYDSDSDRDNLFRAWRFDTHRHYDISSDDDSEDDFVRLPRGRARGARDDAPLVDDILLGDFGDGLWFSPRGRSRRRAGSGGNARVRDQSSEDRRRQFGRRLW
ncbi:hypothetical protein FQN53_007230 [Emmonsiellopsis sp. PD_33]|nr:hypothetical protein FQN53_007230 [Emmonsiellopsis sp. PD_33]